MSKVSYFQKFLLAATQTTIITVGIAGVAHASPYFVSIDFDTDAIGNLGNSLNAPSAFSQTTALTDLYAPYGVVFGQPGNLSGGAILGGSIQEQLDNFGISARSGSNFLAFNRSANLSNGGVPTDPQIISFPGLINAFSIFASGGFESATFQLQAFNANNVLLGTTTITTAPGEWGELSFNSSSRVDNISQIILTQTDSNNSFVYDDLVLLAGVSVIPEPTAALGLLGFSAIGFSSLLKHKKQRL